MRTPSIRFVMSRDVSVCVRYEDARPFKIEAIAADATLPEGYFEVKVVHGALPLKLPPKPDPYRNLVEYLEHPGVTADDREAVLRYVRYILRNYDETPTPEQQSKSQCPACKSMRRC